MTHLKTCPLNTCPRWAASEYRPQEGDEKLVLLAVAKFPAKNSEPQPEAA
jgi:hypothetical protein